MPNVYIEVSYTRSSSHTLKFTHAHKFKLICADYVFILSDAANDALSCVVCVARENQRSSMRTNLARERIRESA